MTATLRARLSSAVLVDPVSSGTLVLNSDGGFDFTPAENFVGDATFSYKANDSELDSNVVAVTITVDPVNDAPIAIAGCLQHGGRHRAGRGGCRSAGQ